MIPTFRPGEEPMVPLCLEKSLWNHGCRVWDRYSVVTRALPSLPTPILGLEDVWVWVPLPTENVKSQQEPSAFFCRT